MRHAIEFDKQVANRWSPGSRGVKALFAVAALVLTVPARAAQAEGGSAGASKGNTGPVNTVERIEVVGAEDGVHIRLEGTGEATYTVFKLAEPPRLVVDLAGTDLSAVRRLTEVGKGNVRAILTTQFNDAARKVGRVMVVLEQDAPYRVRTEGQDVVIVVEGTGPGPGSLAEAGDPPREETKEERTADAVVAVTQDGSNNKEPATEPAETTAKAEPSEEREGARTVLPPGVVARKVDQLETPGRQGDRVLSVVARTRGRTARVDIETDGDPEVVEVLELVDPPRLAVDLYGMHSAPRRARVAGLRGRILTGVRIGKHRDKVRIVVDGAVRTGRMPPYALRRTPRGVAVVVTAPEATPAVATAPSGPMEKRQRSRATRPGKRRALSYARTGSVGRVVAAVAGHHDVQPDRCAADVLSLLTQLQRHGLVVVGAGG